MKKQLGGGNLHATEERATHRQWVCWRWVKRDGRMTKPPLMRFHATETLRLFESGEIRADLRRAEDLRVFLGVWRKDQIKLAEIYQKGPRPLRDAASARNAALILEDHGWLVDAGATSQAGKRTENSG